MSSLAFATLEGCFVPDQLPAIVTWVYGGHLRVVGLHEATAGCDPTTEAAYARTYMDVQESANLTLVTFQLSTLSPLERCGRMQLDVATSEAAEDVRWLVIDFGRDCGAAYTVTGYSPPPPVPEVPEPATLGLVLLGMTWLLRKRWRVR